MKDYQIKITIKSIIRAEQLLKKPFGQFDLDHEDDFLALLYCVALCNSGESLLFEEFKELCDNPKIFTDLVRSFKKESERIAQFQAFLESKDEDDEPQYFGKQISSLIIRGHLDIEYVYEELGLEDMPDLFRTVEEVERMQLEHQRLWTYIAVLPHIDGKKIKSPQDLYPFPWEEEEIRKREEEEFEEGEKTFKKFMNGEIKFNLNGK